MPSQLFQPVQLRNLTLSNRIIIAPMCQYSANDGNASDWHIVHLGHLSLSGAGLLIIEATGVEPRGRITPNCLGLYSDENEEALSRVLKVVRSYSDMPVGLQLGHAGRKASMMRPSDGRGMIPQDKGGWQTVAPSAAAFSDDWPHPEAMDRQVMDEVIAAFVQATHRCVRLGIDLLEIHSAHGYLLSSFLSPLANLRTDQYGGSLQNRMRFPLEVFEAVRAEWPKERPLGVRFNGTDWLDGGITTDEAVRYAFELANRGCDYVDVSSGGNGFAKIPNGPGYQVPFATRIKNEVGIPTMAVGLIRAPQHAEAIVRGGQADMVSIGRGFLNDPRWTWHAAEVLGERIHVPPQYMRAATSADIPDWTR
ncbi:NADH:flavin oxidoreductase/NADH oxidase [Microvirga roseola]|uniref:NADH:flavin oxidoreductase/NADH oxidase n=1 Tax=Microvirga roseola TaxID=2883126 RepID=UPI001E60B2C2|nr:NADH:flavin oxidoreductase/NADH oxidase [Microvirga roseola]